MRTVTVIHGEWEYADAFPMSHTVHRTVIEIPEGQTLQAYLVHVKLEDVLFVFDGDVKPILLD